MRDESYQSSRREKKERNVGNIGNLVRFFVVQKKTKNVRTINFKRHGYFR
jgi:hypothetical protein